MKNIHQNCRGQIEIKQIIIYIFVAILILIGLKSSIFTILAFLFLVFYLFMASEEKMVEALVFFLAFMNVFKLNPSSTSLFTYLQLIPITKIFFKKYVFQKKPFAMSFFLILYAVILTVLNGTSSTVLIRFVVEITLLLVFFGTNFYLSIVPRNLVVFYSLGVLVSSAFGKLNTLVPEIDSYKTVLYVRIDSNTIAYRFSGLIANSNYYSVEVSVVLACLLILFIRNNIDKEFYMLSIPLIIFGIMSQSKTFVISLVILVLVYLFYVSTHKDIRRILFGIIVGVLILIVFSSVIGSFIDLYFSRILDIFSEDATMSSATTGRWDIWSAYIVELSTSMRNTFWGNGLETNAQIGPSHNIFIQCVYCLGIIGTFLFVAWMVSFRKIEKNKKGIIVLIVLMILRLFAANLLFYPNFYYYLILLFALLYSDKVYNRTVVGD